MSGSLSARWWTTSRDGRRTVPDMSVTARQAPRLGIAVPLLLTVGAGALLAWQSHVNASLSDGAQSWLLAALVSFTVGALALSVLALLGVTLTVVVLGLYAVDVDGLESGPLADYISFDSGRIASHLHGFIFNFLLVLVALHLSDIAFYRLRLKVDLVRPMVTGRAPAPEGHGDAHGTGPASRWRALLGIGLAAGVSWAVAKGFHFH